MILVRHIAYPNDRAVQGVVCDRSLAGIVGSNPAADMNAWRFWVLCVVKQRSLLRADHSFRGVLPSVVGLSVIINPRQWDDLGPTGAIAAL